MDLRRHVSILWSSAWIVVGSLIAAIALGLFVTAQLPRTYEARATLYVGQSLTDPDLGYNGVLASQVMAQTYAQLATTRPIMAKVIDELGLTTSPDALAGQVTTELQPQGTLLTVVAHDADPTRVTLIANSVARQLQGLAPQVDSAAAADARSRLASLDATISTTEQQLLELLGNQNRTPEQEQQLANLEQRLTSLSAARDVLANNLPGSSPNTLTLVNPAGNDAASFGPSRALIVGGLAAVAVALSVAVAYIRAAWQGSRPGDEEPTPEPEPAPVSSPPAARRARRSQRAPQWPQVSTEDPRLRP